MDFIGIDPGKSGGMCFMSKMLFAKIIIRVESVKAIISLTRMLFVPTTVESILALRHSKGKNTLVMLPTLGFKGDEIMAHGRSQKL